MLRDYEYRGLMSQAWDVFRSDTSDWPDRHFYLKLIQKYGQPVLDIGCGTGRLLLDYLALGIDIDGMDNSPEMLAICQQKAEKLGLTPTVYEQYLEMMTLPRQYRTIFIPYTHQLIVEPTLVVQALQRVYEHLLPGGVVASATKTLWKVSDPLEKESVKTAVRGDDGATFRHVAYARYEPSSECEHTEDLFQVIKSGQVVAEELHQRSPVTRSYTQAQARTLFEDIGFNPVTLYKESTFEPVKADDKRFTVIGYKASH